MSRRWRGLHNRDEVDDPDITSQTSLAGKLASQLHEYHAKCLVDASYAGHLLHYSAADAILLPKNEKRGSGTHDTEMFNTANANATTAVNRTQLGRHAASLSPANSRPHVNVDAVVPMHHDAQASPNDRENQASPGVNHMATPTHAPAQGYVRANGLPNGNTIPTSNEMNSSTPSDGSDNLMTMSFDGFANLDRVIMSDGADFSFAGFDIPDFSFGNFNFSPNT